MQQKPLTKFSTDLLLKLFKIKKEGGIQGTYDLLLKLFKKKKGGAKGKRNYHSPNLSSQVAQ